MPHPTEIPMPLSQAIATANQMLRENDDPSSTFNGVLSVHRCAALIKLMQVANSVLMEGIDGTSPRLRMPRW